VVNLPAVITYAHNVLWGEPLVTYGTSFSRRKRFLKKKACIRSE
jgi:hypothetical protein